MVKNKVIVSICKNIYIKHEHRRLSAMLIFFVSTGYLYFKLLSFNFPEVYIELLRWKSNSEGLKQEKSPIQI